MSRKAQRQFHNESLLRDRLDILVEKKSVHIKFSRDLHSRLRIECFKRKLSLQEVFEFLASRIVTEDPVILQLLDEYSEDKLNRKLSKLNEIDMKSIFDMIDSVSPIETREAK